MRDRIFEAFLRRQHEEGLELAESSDLLELYPSVPEDGGPPQHYMARFYCKGLVRFGSEVFEWDRFEVLVYFPDDYLRAADPFQVLTCKYPAQFFHPKKRDRAPFICVGRLAPGTGLVDILFQCWEIITYNKVTMREDDALNTDACAWARQNQHRFPVDRRPLKRRSLSLEVELGGPETSGEE